MKRLLLISSAIVLIVLVFSGCATQAQVSTPAPTSVSAPQTTTSSVPTNTSNSKPTSNPIIMRVAPSTIPLATIAQGIVMSSQIQLIETRTNGRIKGEIYWGETLSKGADCVSAIQNGLADVSYFTSYTQGGKTPLATVAEIVGISQEYWAMMSAFWDLMNQEPLSSEFSKYKMHPIGTWFQQDIGLLLKKPISSVADLKGKIIAAGGTQAKIISLLGATPASIPAGEQYEGLLRGTVEGLAAPPDAIDTFKFYEVGKYYVKIPLGGRISACVMNQDYWNKLPVDIQQTIKNLVPDFINISYDTIINKTNGPAFQNFAKAGVTIIDLSPQDIAQVKSVESGLSDEWVASMEAQGLPAKQLLGDWTALVKKYEAISPYKK
jgi:TRAP-type C4-dicarboxylate transport system substrate-binding protein